MAVSEEEKANILNDFFSSVFTKEDLKNIPKLDPGSRSDGVSLTEILITPKAVQEKLAKLDPCKAFGPDGIPPRVLKEASEELSVPLCLFFNKSLDDGTVPADWKKSQCHCSF